MANCSRGYCLTPPGNQSLHHGVSDYTVRQFAYIFGMVLIPGFSIFGCVGNVLSLIVLFHHRMRSNTNFCLAALAISDTLLLIHSLIFSSINMVKAHDYIMGINVRSYMYPFFGAYGSVVTARITSGITTMLCVERFIAVYSPIKAKHMCGRKHTVIGIILIYAVTIILFIPYAFKYGTRDVYIFKHGTNITITKLELTEFGKNRGFHLVYGTILNVFLRFLPIIAIMVLNSLIALAIRKTWAKRRQMSQSTGHSSSQEQHRITTLLLTVSCVFVICIVPGAIHNIVSKIHRDYSRIGSQKNLFMCVMYVTYLLETVNSAVNFVIYVALSKKFWVTYKEIFCCQKVPAKTPLSSRASDQAHGAELVPKKRGKSSTTSLTSYTTVGAGNGTTKDTLLMKNTNATGSASTVAAMQAGKKTRNNDLENGYVMEIIKKKCARQESSSSGGGASDGNKDTSSNKEEKKQLYA